MIPFPGKERRVVASLQRENERKEREKTEKKREKKGGRHAKEKRHKES